MSVSSVSSGSKLAVQLVQQPEGEARESLKATAKRGQLVRGGVCMPRPIWNRFFMRQGT